MSGGVEDREGPLGLSRKGNHDVVVTREEEIQRVGVRGARRHYTLHRCQMIGRQCIRFTPATWITCKLPDIIR